MNILKIFQELSQSINGWRYKYFTAHTIALIGHILSNVHKRNYFIKKEFHLTFKRFLWIRRNTMVLNTSIMLDNNGSYPFKFGDIDDSTTYIIDWIDHIEVAKCILKKEFL